MEDYNNHKCKALIPSIVLSCLIIFITILIFLLTKSIIFKITVIIGCLFVVCLIFTFCYSMSPRTNIIRKTYNQKDLIAYITNSHGRSYLNLYYKGSKYVKEFNRKEDYEIIMTPEIENPENITYVSPQVSFTATIITNIFSMLSWN